MSPDDLKNTLAAIDGMLGDEPAVDAVTADAIAALVIDEIRDYLSDDDDDRSSTDVLKSLISTLDTPRKVAFIGLLLKSVLAKLEVKP